ncbi:disks large-associated protein 1 isoform X1 [Fundulus heteroclitus]|uniref:Discs, large (Drosophila) homolog-associated protein 1a n=2 Tax=Fundulus heteroclitus TaxID=8078 RepID=A0A3Q2Q6M5_FUNHE|nr:disks large-associated protein 1 isoform X1 [Fundulus heteroclitus]XP_035993703.1 disks large-associated protein 1 isoform X1 [Fundulus heteroclitus]
MKGLSSSRSHHHVVSYEPYDPLGHHVDRKPYLFSQMDMPLPIPMPHPSELSYYNAQRVSYPSESNSIVPYGTFPRRCHSTSSAHHPEVKDECMAMLPYVGGGGRGGGGGGGYGGKSQSWVPVSFADPFEQQPIFSRDGYHTLQYKRGVLSHSGGIGANDNNNDSPGRIRHLVHSVQKLFTKSHSLEGAQQSSKGANNGSVYGGGGGGSGGGGSRASPEGAAPPGGVRHRKRSKSRERCRSAEPKHRSYHHHHHPQLHGSASAPGSGYWSSDDNLERELCLYHPHHHQPPPSPSLSISPSPVAISTGHCPGNNPDKYPQAPLPNLSSSQSQQYFMMDPYGTVNEHTHTHARHGRTHHHSALKASWSNSDVKYTASSPCVPVSGNSNKSDVCIGGGSGPLLPLGLVDGPIEKKGAWSSSLTVSRAQEVYTNSSSHNQLRASAGSGNLDLDRALVKSKGSQQQDPSCQFLQVPQDEWSGFSPLGKEEDIPCRRMRSGSYVKAMAEDDSGDSDGSPKPSPKMQARRASYLKATQPSLTEMTTLQISTEHSPKLQIRSHSYLRAVSEVSINRSMDTLDPKTLLDPKSLLSSPQYRSRNESYMRAMSTISQLSEVEVNGQIEQVCEQVYSEMQSQAMDPGMDSLETMDTLPMPGCFRMRSPSYVRAIDQGCTSEDEGPGGRPLLLLPSSPPRTTATTVRTIQSSTVSSCITTYKKTPPPVPPRTSTCSTASKPYISITAQSSTESAQDAYMEEEGPRGDMTIQSGLSNSTESIDSMKALTAAIEAANAQVHGPASQHVSNSTMTVSTANSSHLSRGHVVEDHRDEYRKEALRKGKCLSIGIQVDGPEEIPDPEDPSKFTSVGVQVEDDRGYRRLQRSNSVTAAVQADLDLPDLLDTPLDVPHPHRGRLSSCGISRKYSRDAATSTVSIQGSGNHYHACTSDDYEDVGFDPSILPPPDPWIDTVTDDPLDSDFNGSSILEVVQRSVCQRDGRWFLKLLQAETDRLEGWCRQMELDQRENELPEDILEKMRAAVGSAQLLISQKFQQFRELCEENLNPSIHPRPVASDLAGFWDMLQLSIENISLKFDELHQLRANNWRPLDPPDRKERRLPPPVPKKPHKVVPHHHPPLARDRSLESSEKQRQEARKRLMAAKRAASVRQNSATESADSIEIYIPEAQTRL